MENYGKKIKERRLQLGLTQMEVADAAGISMRCVQSLEYGDRSILLMRFENGLKICAVLEMDPYDLLFGESRCAYRSKMNEQ